MVLPALAAGEPAKEASSALEDTVDVGRIQIERAGSDGLREALMSE